MSQKDFCVNNIVYDYFCKPTLVDLLTDKYKNFYIIKVVSKSVSRIIDVYKKQTHDILNMINLNE